MSLRFARRRFFTAALLVAALAIPSLAFASGGNSLRVKVHSKADHYTVTGGSSSASNTLELLTNKGTVECKSTFAADYPHELDFVHVPLNKGSFRKKFRLFQGLPGKYRVCVYIVATSTTFPPPTLAHAGAKFAL